jgi:hypothetical protein
LKKSEKWMTFAVLGALGIVVLCLVCVIGAVMVPLRWWSHGGAAEAAKDYLRKNSVVQAQLGAVKGFGRFPTGSESIINGQGSAHFFMTVQGERKEGRAEIELARKPGQTWQVTSAVLMVEGRPIRLDGTLVPPSLPPPSQPQDDSTAGRDARPLNI